MMQGNGISSGGSQCDMKDSCAVGSCSLTGFPHMDGHGGNRLLGCSIDHVTCHGNRLSLNRRGGQEGSNDGTCMKNYRTHLFIASSPTQNFVLTIATVVNINIDDGRGHESISAERGKRSFWRRTECQSGSRILPPIKSPEENSQKQIPASIIVCRGSYDGDQNDRGYCFFEEFFFILLSCHPVLRRAKATFLRI